MFKVTQAVLWLLYPLVPINPELSDSNLHELCRTYTFDDSLARRLLHYSPIYTRKQGLKRTVKFYDNMYKKALYSCLVDKALASKHVGMLRQMPKLKKDITALNLADRGKSFRGKVVQNDLLYPWLPK